MTVPNNIKLYHIVHVDRLPSILADNWLWSDSEVRARNPAGTTIGMSTIKQRRLNELTLSSHPNLYVGACVPFYFCPRSVMLYLIHVRNHELSYQGGQEPIVHLQVDLNAAVQWANQNNLRWAFTLSNAGSYYFEDRNDLTQLDEIDWPSVNTTQWSSCKEGKQAEFLVERCFPWQLIEFIGVYSQSTYQQVTNVLLNSRHRPNLSINSQWYY